MASFPPFRDLNDAASNNLASPSTIRTYVVCRYRDRAQPLSSETNFIVKNRSFHTFHWGPYGYYIPPLSCLSTGPGLFSFSRDFSVFQQLPPPSPPPNVSSHFSPSFSCTREQMSVVSRLFTHNSCGSLLIAVPWKWLNPRHVFAI